MGRIAALSIWGAGYHGGFAVDWAGAGMAGVYRCSSGAGGCAGFQIHFGGPLDFGGKAVKRIAMS